MSGFTNKSVIRLINHLYNRTIIKCNNLTLTDEDRHSKIIMFHDINSSATRFSITCLQLEQILLACTKLGYSYISLDEFLNNPCDELLFNKIIVSFDDGLRSLYTEALPILMKYQIPFIAYITTSFIGRVGYLTIDELKNLSMNKLCTIGSHLHNHVMTRYLEKNEIQREITQSIDFLQNITEKSVRHVAFPYGSMLACSYQDVKIAKEQNLVSVALTTQKYLVRKNMKHPYGLPRIDATTSSFLAAIYK